MANAGDTVLFRNGPHSGRRGRVDMAWPSELAPGQTAHMVTLERTPALPGGTMLYALDTELQVVADVD